MAELSNDDKALLKRIDEWFEAHRQNIIEDIERLVRIPSVSKPPKEDNLIKKLHLELSAGRLWMKCLP